MRQLDLEFTKSEVTAPDFRLADHIDDYDHIELMAEDGTYDQIEEVLKQGIATGRHFDIVTVEEEHDGIVAVFSKVACDDWPYGVNEFEAIIGADNKVKINFDENVR